MDVRKIQDELAKFATEREWERFHSPKNISMAIAGEAGELVALFQWLSEAESRRDSLGSQKLARVSEEISDVLIYALRLCDVLELDVENIVREKMLNNALRYPVELARGNATKYSERES